ncbi:immunity 22 family protein [Pseudoalteromonas denitrificans]|uniref:Immunity protein 22 n=1 Tax=Pseudoalteromonas denitrificans DSM 6059 TaxID=1123010 RepID=A0A1I1MJW9_9GAMM|nr:immunity 22 family protein [Pseudoalteromonas denitrificans]SFC81840.1 Immunity protein 22 [Pseudoalteromonas denitrificans DSM 6059]
MKTKPTNKGHDFTKKKKVSIWASQYPYQDIPEAYFEETFSRKNTRAVNVWSENFKLCYFNPENMETNGTMEGLIDIKQAVGACSFSTSYIVNLMSKAKQKKLENVSWVVLLFENEYSVKTTSVAKDEYLTFLGAFTYDNSADNLFEAE